MNATTFQNDIISLQSRMLNFALMLTGYDHQDACDLVQDTTLKALDNESKYKPGSNLSAWLFTIMRNLFINEYRHSVVAATVNDTSESLYQLNLCQESGLEAPETTVSVHEISNEICALDEVLREPFTLHVKGYKYEEICDMLNLPMGTVKNRIFLARKRLQATFADYR